MGSSSDQPCHFLLDPLLLSVPTIRMSGSFEGEMNSSIFSYFLPATSKMTTEVEQVEKNCFDKNSNNANVIDQALDNSSVSAECVEQASSGQSLTEKKRKNRGKKKDKENSGKKLKNDSMQKKAEQIIKKCTEKYDKSSVEDQCSAHIHVRARRGQATDSHSLAERARREKISERMKVLQSLVPGCSKITGKALVLDEIINYVQSLQNQVEVATVTPFLYDISMDFDDPSIVSQENMSLLWGVEDQRQSIENLSGFSMSYFH